MAVKMQTSFIPKKPIIENNSADSGVSLFLLLSIIVFIVAVALAGGVWVWQNSLIAQIEKDKKELVAVRESYEDGITTKKNGIIVMLNDLVPIYLK